MPDAPRFVVGRALPALALAAVLIAFAVPVVGQTVTGTVQGTVTDTTAAPIPGVTVTIRNVDTGLVREVVTNVRACLAIEIMTAAAGLDQRAPLRPSRGVQAALEVVRSWA